MKLTKKMLVDYLKKVSGESGDMAKGDGFWVVSGKQGKQYSEYSYGDWFINLDGSCLYEAFNYGWYNPMTGKYNWNVLEKFQEFLSKFGYYFEMGNAWNMALMKG